MGPILAAIGRRRRRSVARNGDSVNIGVRHVDAGADGRVARNCKARELVALSPTAGEKLRPAFGDVDMRIIRSTPDGEESRERSRHVTAGSNAIFFAHVFFA
jgi:hypothetical protein